MPFGAALDIFAREKPWNSCSGRLTWIIIQNLRFIQNLQVNRLFTSGRSPNAITAEDRSYPF
ncbi:MAG: hypothetical protein NTAFB09_23130 [Nitrosospira sp.]